MSKWVSSVPPWYSTSPVWIDSGPTTPGLYFDWTGTGFGSGANDDATDNMVGYTVSKGADPMITGATNPGTMTVTLNNPSNLYNPDNASGPLFGMLEDGVRVWLGMGADGTLTDSTVLGVFGGLVTSISVLPMAGQSAAPQVEITCEDKRSWYGRQNVNIADSTTRSQKDLRAAILAAVGETNTDLAPETWTLPLSSASGDALAMLSDLNAANGTRDQIVAATTADAWYTYKTTNRLQKLTGSADATLSTEDDHVTGLSGWIKSGDGVLNQQSVVVQPIDFPLGLGTVWTYVGTLPLVVVSGTEQVIWANFDDYVKDPVVLSLHTGSSLTATLTPFGTTAKIVLSSSGTTSVTSLTIAGHLVERLPAITVTVDDASSQSSSRGVRVGPTIQGDDVGTAAMAEGIAGAIVWRYAEPLTRPGVDVVNWLPEMYSLELFDIVAFTSAQMAVSGMQMELVGITLNGIRGAAGLVNHTASLTLAQSRVQSDPGWFVLNTSELNSADILGY